MALAIWWHAYFRYRYRLLYSIYHDNIPLLLFIEYVVYVRRCLPREAMACTAIAALMCCDGSWCKWYRGLWRRRIQSSDRLPLWFLRYHPLNWFDSITFNMSSYQGRGNSIFNSTRGVGESKPSHLARHGPSSCQQHSVHTTEWSRTVDCCTQKPSKRILHDVNS